MIPTNFKDAKIYKLTCNGLTYYGSTCNSLAKRLIEHKSKAKRFGSNSSRYSSFVLFQQGAQPIIELVEQVQCNTYLELLTRERYYIENNVCVNKKVPLRTDAEWYELHRPRRLEQMKALYYKKKRARLAAEQAILAEQTQDTTGN